LMQQFDQLLDYEVADVTAASTFYLAEIYAHFSQALMESERPENLTPLELEQYELAIEEQAYPFEEKAITVHESNLDLMSMGIYNSWIDKSLQQLARIMPARYSRPEAESPVMTSLSTYTFEIGGRPADATAEETNEQILSEVEKDKPGSSNRPLNHADSPQDDTETQSTATTQAQSDIGGESQQTDAVQ
jgi:hypothetical protein